MRYKIKYKYKMGLPKKNVFFFHSRKNLLSLIVALNDSQLAEGQLYWDDGVRIGKCKDAHLHKKIPQSQHPQCANIVFLYFCGLWTWTLNFHFGDIVQQLQNKAVFKGMEQKKNTGKWLKW